MCKLQTFGIIINYN